MAETGELDWAAGWGAAGLGWVSQAWRVACRLRGGSWEDKGRRLVDAEVDNGARGDGSVIVSSEDDEEASPLAKRTGPLGTTGGSHGARLGGSWRRGIDGGERVRGRDCRKGGRDWGSGEGKLWLEGEAWERGSSRRRFDGGREGEEEGRGRRGSVGGGNGADEELLDVGSGRRVGVGKGGKWCC